MAYFIQHDYYSLFKTILKPLFYIKMSARNFSNNKSTSAYVPRAPCCKVCKDAGEPESVYASHYVKDRDGNVTCPKLKTIVCINCGKRGHTSSYCKAPSKEAAAYVRTTEATKKPFEPTAAPVAKGRFACLFEDDSDDEKLLARKHTRPAAKTSYKQQTVAKETAPEASPLNVSNVFDFPSLSADTKMSPAMKPIGATSTKIFSYANMAAKPVEAKPIRQVIAVPTKHVRHDSPITVPPRHYQKASEMDWAAFDSDSDDGYDKDF